jgi:hypothetical protein
MSEATYTARDIASSIGMPVGAVESLIANYGIQPIEIGPAGEARYSRDAGNQAYFGLGCDRPQYLTALAAYPPPPTPPPFGPPPRGWEVREGGAVIDGNVGVGSGRVTDDNSLSRRGRRPGGEIPLRTTDAPEL